MLDQGSSCSGKFLKRWWYVKKKCFCGRKHL